MQHLRLIDRADLGMNPQSKPRLPAFVFLFDELVIPRPTAELNRKTPLEKLIEIAVEIVHPLAGEFFITPDVMEVDGETGLLQSAPAVPRARCSVVADFHIEQQRRR